LARRVFIAAPTDIFLKRGKILGQWLVEPFFRHIRQTISQHVVENKSVKPAQDFRIALLHTDMRRRVTQNDPKAARL
jgi:hypothetical protein